MGTIADLSWKKADKIYQVIEALHAYAGVMGLLHPYDYGPRNILRNLFNWHYFQFRGSDQLHSTKEVVNAVLARNASRASQRKPPMTIAELDDFFKRTLRSLGGPSSVPELSNNDFLAFKQSAPVQNQHLFNPLSLPTPRPQRPTNPARPPVQINPKPKSVAIINGMEVCSQFNSARGFPRSPTGQTCTITSLIDGSVKTLCHKCSFKSAPGAPCCGNSHPKFGNH